MGSFLRKVKSLFTIIFNDKIVIADNNRSSCLCAIMGGGSPTFIKLMYFSLNYNMKGCDHSEKIFVLSSLFFFWLTPILKWIILDGKYIIDC